MTDYTEALIIPEGKQEKTGLKERAVRSLKRIKVFDLVFGVIVTVLVVSAIYIYVITGEDEKDPYTDEGVNAPVGINVGEKAPDFTLVDTEGRTFALSDHRGEVVILDFMATWCDPCVEEMDELKQVNMSYYERGARIISIDTDNREDAKQLHEFKNLHTCPWRFAAQGSDVGETYAVKLLPTLYIIDEKGIIRYFSTTEKGERGGMVRYPEMAEELDRLLK